jgi:hypothetical protein
VSDPAEHPENETDQDRMLRDRLEILDAMPAAIGMSRPPA